jgi:hypothetical protein
VKASSGKGKDEWIKFEIVQQSAIAPQEAPRRSTTSAESADRPPEIAEELWVKAAAGDPESIRQISAMYTILSAADSAEVRERARKWAEAHGQSDDEPSRRASNDALASNETPKSGTENSNSGFPAHWKSMTDGTVRTLRFEGEYIYGEQEFSEAAAKAGEFSLVDVKRDVEKYVGKMNRRVASPDGGASCAGSWPIELTLVTPSRIEGRVYSPPPNATTDWRACTYSPQSEWQPFSWIPVR